MPAKPTVQCEGIVVEIGPSGVSQDTAFKEALEAAAELPGEWGVEPLTEGSREFLVTRWSGAPLAAGRAWDIAERLAQTRSVREAEPAFRCEGIEPEYFAEALAPGEQTRARSSSFSRPLSCSSDPTWSLSLSGVLEAWRLTPKPGGKRFGESIVIGHPDTGYTTHPEIWPDQSSKRRVLARLGYDFEDDKADPVDPLDGSNAHGTATGSVIMSDDVREGERFVSGAAPLAKLIPYRVSDKVIHFSFKNVARAIDAATEAGAHVISMSLGGVFPSRFLERAIDRAIERGVIVLAAAGNVWPWVVYPARYDHVIAVAAVNCKKEPWSKSASGSDVDISAPGESVWRARTAGNDGEAEYRVAPSSGTSYAVATTAGACALWLSHHGRDKLLQRYGPPNLAAVFREVLKEHGVVRPPRWKRKKYGAGILRADKLLSAPLPESAPAAGLDRSVGRGVRIRPQALDQIAGYLPEAPRSRVRYALSRVLRVNPDQLEEILQEHGDELVFQTATDPVLRGALGMAARGRGRPRGAPRGLSGRVGAPAQLSSRLRARLGI